MKFSPHIIDVTLRDGEQSPGVVFTRREKLLIVRNVQKLGITEMEVGAPARGEEIVQDIRCLAREITDVNLLCWCRMRQEDLFAAMQCETNRIHIAVPSSSVLLGVSSLAEQACAEQCFRLVEFAKKRVDFVSVGMQDGSRASESLRTRFLTAALSAGADRIRLADTVGALDPFTTQRLVQSVVAQCKNIPVEFHAHNDLGMATANSLAAVVSGARAVSVTVNGLGERSGNAALAEVLMALKNAGYNVGHFNLSMIASLSALVSKCAARPIAEDKPIVGSFAHAHESGIHTHGLAKDANSYQLYDPRETGSRGTRIVLGAQSGKAGVELFCKRHGIDLAGVCSMQLLSRIKQLATLKKALVTLADVKRLVAGLTSQRSDDPMIAPRPASNAYCAVNGDRGRR